MVVIFPLSSLATNHGSTGQQVKPYVMTVLEPCLHTSRATNPFLRAPLVQPQVFIRGPSDVMRETRWIRILYLSAMPDVTSRDPTPSL